MSTQVAQRVRTWLPITETWIESQIRHLPADVKSHVLCDRTRNLGSFPLASDYFVMEHHRLPWLMRRLAAIFGCRISNSAEKRFIAAQGISILHSHFADTAWRSLPLARSLGLPHVVTFYGYDVNQLPRSAQWRRRYIELFNAAKLILCEGEHMAQCIIELGAPPDNVIVHHLGVELAKFEYRPRQADKQTALRILIAASFREKKGIPDGIEAVEQASKHGPIELTIVGDAGKDATSIAEKKRILRAIAKLSENVSVTTTGYVTHDELKTIAYKNDIYLVPSRTARNGDTEGGAPVAAIEMIASGMPLVSTLHCDIPGILPYSQRSRLAAEGDVSALASAINWWRDHPENWHSELTAARQHIETYFDAVTQGARLADIYRRARN